MTVEKAAVQNMEGKNGRAVPNQFEIITPKGIFFQSYSTVIAFRDHAGKVTLDRDKWNYSQTTGKYRNQFLREARKETEAKIKAGVYILADLN